MSKIVYLEKTIVIIKPDGMQKGYAGEVVSRLEKAGFKPKEAKVVELTEELLKVWYVHHKNKPFFPDIVSFMTECPVLAMIWEGKDIISKVRDMAGVTDSTKADKGTIRGDLGEDIQRNVVHISDSPESVEKETKLLFGSDEHGCCGGGCC